MMIRLHLSSSATFVNENMCSTITSIFVMPTTYVLFDKEMNLISQINNIRKSTFYYIWTLSVIHNIMDEQSSKVAVHAFVTHGLDYVNSLLYGLPNPK